MRPGPEETAVVQVVGREVVGQDLAIEPVERMDVGAVRAGRGSVFLGACPVVVDQDGPIAFPEAQRSVVDLGKPERARRAPVASTAEPGRLTSRTAIRAPKFVTQLLRFACQPLGASSGIFVSSTSTPRPGPTGTASSPSETANGCFRIEPCRNWGPFRAAGYFRP